MKRSKLAYGAVGTAAVALAAVLATSRAQPTPPMPESPEATNRLGNTLTNIYTNAIPGGVMGGANTNGQGGGNTNEWQGGGKGWEGMHGRLGQPAQLQGTVAQFLLTPDGMADGVLLSDGTQVDFPSRQSTNLTSTIKTNTNVNVKGIRRPDGLVIAETITETSTGQAVTNSGPGGFERPLPSILRGVGLTQQNSSGTVKTPLHGWRGGVDGVVLDNGTIVLIDPRASESLTNLTQTGQALAAQGYGTTNEWGKSFLATEIGPNASSLTPIYDEPVGGTTNAPSGP